MQEDINKALDVLHNGGIILYPTDTIWGIGCDATNEEAVKRIFKIKNREDSKSMIILVDKERKIESYVKDVPEIAWDLIEASVEPLTIIYPGGRNVASNLIAEDGSLAIRICETEFIQKLIMRFKRPIVSTSANISGTTAPSSFHDIAEEIKNQMDYIVQIGRDVPSHKPSSIIMLGIGGEIKVIR